MVLIREKQVSIIKSPSSNPAATNQAIYYLQAGSILPGNWFIALVNTCTRVCLVLHSYTVTQLAAVTQPRIFSPGRSGRSTRHPLLHLLHLHHPDGHPQDSPCKNCNCHEPGDTCDRYKIHNTMTTYKINTILLPDRYRDTEVILSLAGSCCLLNGNGKGCF